MRWDFWRKNPSPPEPGPSSPRTDNFNRLLRARVVFVSSAIDDAVANVVMAQLLFLQFENGSTDIALYIDSPAGSVTASLAIYDTMAFFTEIWSDPVEDPREQQAREAEVERLKQALFEIFAKHTRLSVKEVALQLDRRRRVSLERALKIGLIDKVIDARNLPAADPVPELEALDPDRRDGPPSE